MNVADARRDLARIANYVHTGFRSPSLATTASGSVLRQVFSWLLLTLGALSVFDGMLVQAFALASLGLLVLGAVRCSFGPAPVRHLLTSVAVEEVMWTAPGRVDSELSLDRFVRTHLIRTSRWSFARIEANAAYL